MKNLLHLKLKKVEKKKIKRGPKTKPYSENKAGGTQQWKKVSESNKENDYSLEQLIHMTLLTTVCCGQKKVPPTICSVLKYEDGKEGCASKAIETGIILLIADISR